MLVELNTVIRKNMYDDLALLSAEGTILNSCAEYISFKQVTSEVYFGL